MLKTYIYIPDSINEQIIDLAKAKKKSKAEVIRSALESGLNAVQRQEIASAQVLLKIAELGEKYKVSGPKDSSERIDELLWEKNWEKDDNE